MKTAVVLALLFAVYCWMPHRAFQGFALQAHHNDQYNALTDGFLAGHLYMPQEAPPGLLALADPYDPATNGQYRYNYGLWDQSLYKGHLYLYFGVTPVVTGYLPYRLLTHGLRLPNPLAVLGYTYGALLFAAGLLFGIRRRYFRQVPDWMLLSAVALVGAADLAFYLLSQSNIYQVAIAAGMFFSLGALYCLSRGFEPTTRRPWWFLAAGLCLAFAIGSRPHFAATGGLVFAISMIALWRRRERRWARYASLAIPAGTGVFLLGFYNWLRFGSFFDFGAHYQLGVLNMHSTGMFAVAKIWPTLYYMLVQPPTVNSTYPWVHPMPKLPTWIPSPPGLLLERISGILVGTPFLWMILAAAFLMWRRRRAPAHRPLPWLELTFFVVSLGFLVTMLSLAGPTMRYLADFAGLFDMTAVVAWFYLDTRLELTPRARTVSRAVGMVLLVTSIIIGFLFAMPPPYHYNDG